MRGPRGQPQVQRAQQWGRVQPGIAGPPRGCRAVAGRDRAGACRRERQRHPAGCRARYDILRESMPDGRAGHGQVVGASGQPPLDAPPDRQRRRVGDEGGRRRRAVLLGHDLQAFPGLSQSQDGFQEVLAVRRMDPAGPESQGIAARVADDLLARELGGAVDVEGGGGVGFRVGLPCRRRHSRSNNARAGHPRPGRGGRGCPPPER